MFCIFQANGLQDLESMWRLLMEEEEAACITCPVRPVNPFESFLALSQSFECENLRTSSAYTYMHKGSSIGGTPWSSRYIAVEGMVVGGKILGGLGGSSGRLGSFESGRAM